MATTSSSYLFHFLLRSQPSVSVSVKPSFVSFLKPLFLSSPNALSTHFPTPPFVTFSPSSSFSVPPSLSFIAVVEDSVEDDSDDSSFEEIEVANDELKTEMGNFEDTQMGLESDPNLSLLVCKREERLKLEVSSLTVKERKELASYAHSLGEKLKIQLVGKSSVTSNVLKWSSR